MNLKDMLSARKNIEGTVSFVMHVFEHSFDVAFKKAPELPEVRFSFVF